MGVTNLKARKASKLNLADANRWLASRLGKSIISPFR
jgi:hypothetical protein